jgi:tetratricopeptide (TPR) repeat protein
MGHLNFKLAAEPTNREALLAKFTVLGQLKYFNTILTILKLVFPNGPKGDLLVSQGYALQGLGKQAESVKVYEEALLQPQSESTQCTIHSNAGNAFDALGDGAAAERHYKLSVAAHPPVATLYFNYGEFLIRHRRWKEVLEVAENGIRNSRAGGHSGFLPGQKIQALVGLGRDSEALTVAEGLVSSEQHNLGRIFVYAQLLIKCGRKAEAVVQIDRMLAIDPQNVQALRAKVKLASPPSQERPR